MSCTEYQSMLSELLDGTLPRDRRSQVEAHVASCAECGAALADFRRIREQARSLPKVVPPDSLWEKVRSDYEGQAGQLRGKQGGLHLQAGSSRQAGGLSHSEPKVLSVVPRRRHLLAGLAAAAALVLASSAGVYYMTRQPVLAPQLQPAAAHAQPADNVQSIESELQLAVQHYQNAITGLEKVATEGQASLDPQTAAVLAKSNAILDQAVSESQAALRTQPTSEVARASLFEALQRKVALLRDTVSLINEMRKGDAAGTARVAGSIGKS